MAIARVQQASGSTQDGGTSLSATWPSATTAGNLLLACMCFETAPGTITLPSGWSLVKVITNGVCVTRLYHITNAGSRSGAETFTLQGLQNSGQLIIAEYSGLTSSPQDLTAVSNTGGTSTPTTGNYGTTSQANELIIAIMGQSGTVVFPTFSAPINSFSIYAQQGGNDSTVLNGSAVGLLDRIVSSTGTFSTAVTSTKSETWATIIVGYKATASTAPKQLAALGVG